MKKKHALLGKASPKFTGTSKNCEGIGDAPGRKALCGTIGIEICGIQEIIGHLEEANVLLAD